MFEGYYKQELNCSTFSSEIIDFCSKITGHLDLSILDIPWTVKQAALKYARCYQNVIKTLKNLIFSENLVKVKIFYQNPYYVLINKQIKMNRITLLGL